MGNWNSGRRPEPHAMRVLRGKVKAGARSREPKVPPVDASFDEPPREVAGDKVATDEWRRIAPMLRLCGIVSEADRAVMIAVCLMWSLYQAAQAEVRKGGMLSIGKGGIPYPNPYIGIADKALSQCRRMWGDLGLTPGGRAKLSTTKDPARTPPTSKWQGLLP